MYPGPYRLPLTHLLVWYFDLGLIVECEGPGDCYSVDYGLGLDGPAVTIEAKG